MHANADRGSITNSSRSSSRRSRARPERPARTRLFKIADDPESRRLGAFATHQPDELPQLWNVLRGDMRSSDRGRRFNTKLTSIRPGTVGVWSKPSLDSPTLADNWPEPDDLRRNGASSISLREDVPTLDRHQDSLATPAAVFYGKGRLLTMHASLRPRTTSLWTTLLRSLRT